MENTDFVFLYRIHLQFILYSLLFLKLQMSQVISLQCVWCRYKKQEKIHMQHKIKMQCNNNLFRFIYSFNVRARKKNSQSKIHKCNFFSGEEGRIVDLQSFWVLRVFTYLFCNIGRFVGLPFLSNLEVFCIFKISHFQKLLLAFFVNSLRKSIGGFDHRLTI